MSAEGFAAALAKFQESLPRVTKGNTAKITGDKGSYSYTYADLSDVAASVLPALAAVGLSFTSRSTFIESRFVLEASLLHTDGHREVSTYPLPDPSRATPQQIGSAMTYGRRYALCCLTGVAPAGDDDDARTASQQPAGAAWPTVAVIPASSDAKWIKDWKQSVTDCITRDEITALWPEVTAKHAAREITDDDGVDLREFAKEAAEVLDMAQARLLAEQEVSGELPPSEVA